MLTQRDIRHRLVEMARPRARPGAGSSPEFSRRRDWSSPRLDLSDIRTPYVIVGAIATRLSMPERVTPDIDILVRAQHADALAAELERIGFSRQRDLSVGRSSWIGLSQIELDVIESSDPWIDEVFASAVTAPDGQPVIDLPYLVLLKLKASRGQDVADLSKMLGLATNETLDQVGGVLRRYQPEDIEDLEGLIALGTIENGE